MWDTLQPGEHMSTSSIAYLAECLSRFATERDWDQFHSPKNLAMALTSEAGELAAEFQWLTEPESRSPTPEQLARIRAECADILIYLIRLADKLNIDLVAAAHEKIDENERKYPADKVRGSAKKYTDY
jgi:NTP pyrophosphatase (non-canonical NTP hydrolase)